ncbi:hypothetical protein FGG08_004710 [Glutinoglossum americanum]|uniref:YCII-related domain-containing protein n=1 Tax=Glutinoglossum americanum TaxID=1670608 RepID=A0A9P8KZ89_9PEZI|nr:hypothetical protein FGG08_004710 [Glutinoglossum americanum]
MRFAVIVRADADREAGILPGSQVITAMTKYNEELSESGVMITAEGFHRSSKGARVTLSGDGTSTVVPGPFPESEVASGFWLLQAGSQDEVIEWVKKCPIGKRRVLEIRQLLGAEDFGEMKAEAQEMFATASYRVP